MIFKRKRREYYLIYLCNCTVFFYEMKHKKAGKTHTEIRSRQNSDI